MTTHRTRVAATAAVAFLAAAPAASAQHNPSVLLPVPQVTPQFNDPGPQLVIPPPGNPVQQLAPSLGTGSPAYSAPQVYAVPEDSPRLVTRHSRHHRAAHRHVSRGHVSSDRSAQPPRTRAR
jgi:hypothetical protein